MPVGLTTAGATVVGVPDTAVAGVAVSGWGRGRATAGEGAGWIGPGCGSGGVTSTGGSRSGEADSCARATLGASNNSDETTKDVEGLARLHRAARVRWDTI